ncbi:hypothetical protein PPL_00232 [Heterostelium album PN500]|uniref:Nucleotide exchange factor Fes1 domain-containing protein n=1 Tax=Heterostelium pallidum (strain ATCC 26659 / Pp 5 / PN500) TaxID=670386 RepID=D3AVW7_HETP5|nr:hypothetical protein PPL_00232 [Heterostelium album PN500]EFA86440.1 hypothetical protein PPL_00232 [Heterostelium album PN500]|eukprot:XP_020438545.1 hypothetical protein PPL_00232 [Heterostelium album PN500]
MYLGAPITAKKNAEQQQQQQSNNIHKNETNKPVARSSYQLPKDIGPGLLKFCLTHSDSPNLTDSPIVERDQKDYDWLREAMDNLEDDAKRMKKINETLVDPSSTVGQRISSLEALEYYIEDIDNSGDYIKIGGIPILIDLIKSEDNQIREKATNCLTIISQNEETIQNYMIQIGVDDLAIHLLSTETNTVCREKELSLISSMYNSMVNNCYQSNNDTNNSQSSSSTSSSSSGLLGSKIDKVDRSKLETIVKLCISFLSPTVDIFIPVKQANGHTITTTHSIANSVTGMSKATHILKKIIHGVPSLKSKAIEFGVLEALVTLIHGFNSASVVDPHQTILCEKCEATLLMLLRGDQKSVNECKNLGLEREIQIRQQRMSKTKEENQDEYATIENLSKLLK